MEKSDRLQQRATRRAPQRPHVVRNALPQKGYRFQHAPTGIRPVDGPDYRDPERVWTQSDHPRIAA